MIIVGSRVLVDVPINVVVTVATLFGIIVGSNMVRFTVVEDEMAVEQSMMESIVTDGILPFYELSRSE